MINSDQTKGNLEAILVATGLVVITGLICFLAKISKRQLDMMIEGKDEESAAPQQQQYGSFE